MVFGGTNILQHTERSEGEGVNERSVKCITVPYCVECFCMVLLSRRVFLSIYGEAKSVLHSLLFDFLFL
jgi:hypothetical protein